MGKTTEETNRKGITLTEGILLAAVSADAYLFAFSFELGSNRYYNLPNKFTRIGLAEILTFGTLAVLLSALLLIPIVSLRVAFLSRNNPLAIAISKRLVWTMLALFWAALYSFLDGLLSVVTWIVIAWGVVITVLDFIRPLLSNRRNLKKYTEKLKSTPAAYDRIKPAFDYFFRDRTQSGFIYLFLLTVLGFIVSFTGGIQLARSKTNYLVVNTFPEMVVITMFDDYVVLSPFDRQSKEIQPVFLVQKLDKDPAFMFEMEPVGPLKPKQISTALPASTATLTAIPATTATP